MGTMQCDNTIIGAQFSVQVHHTAHSARGSCHGGSRKARCALVSLCGDKLADVWYDWSENGGRGLVFKWCQVQDQIVVKGVTCPKVADGFEIHLTALPPL